MFHLGRMDDANQTNTPADTQAAAQPAAQKLPWQPPVIEQFDVAAVTQAGAGPYTVVDLVTYSS